MATLQFRRHSRVNSGARVEAVVEEPLEVGPEVEDFANAFDECLSQRLSVEEKRQRLLELPRKYYENTVRRLTKLQPNRRIGSQDDDDMYLDDNDQPAGDQQAEVRELEKEAETWDLLRRVLPLRYGPKDHNEQLSRLGKLGKENLAERFFLSDSVAQERRAVLQWLQCNRAVGRPDIDDMHTTRELQENADRGDIIAHGWLHTRASIKHRKRLLGWPQLLDRQKGNVMETHNSSKGEPLVTQLDPDAPTRQNRKLEPQDHYFEQAIWAGCFEHLRRGSSLQVLREWCQERTELWRAISMSAVFLALDGKDTLADADASALALWRRMCYASAKQGGSDDYERAVYGVLSGDIATVEKVSAGWDDLLFAHYNALLRTQLDNFLLDQCPKGAAMALTQSFPAFDALQFHGEARQQKKSFGQEASSLEQRLIRSFETHQRVGAEAREPNKALQAAFIANDLDAHFYQQGQLMNSARQSESSQALEAVREKEKFFGPEQYAGLRIVSHVFILITLLENLDKKKGGFESKERTNEKENILAEYVEYLRRAKLQELIPIYCSILESPRRYEVLSSALISLETPEQRLTQLKLVKRANVDVLEFVDAQARFFYEKLNSPQSNSDAFEAQTQFEMLTDAPPGFSQVRVIKSDFFGDDEEAVDARDDNVIRSLEWLLLVSEMWPMVFSIGIKAYKYFLRHLHLNAARLLLTRVPFASIMAQLGDEEERDESAYEDPEFWAEHLDRNETQGTSPYKVMHDARVFRQLEALVKALDCLETIGSFIELSVEAPLGDREFWNNTADETHAATKNMNPLLKNWLKAGIEDGDVELLALREAFLPETVLAYISALQFSGINLSRDFLLECMNLASVIVERDSDLQPLFVKAKRMRELLEAFAAASKALAVQTQDKRSHGSSSKKLRENGWSRDLWSVKT